MVLVPLPGTLLNQSAVTKAIFSEKRTFLTQTVLSSDSTRLHRGDCEIKQKPEHSPPFEGPPLAVVSNALRSLQLFEGASLLIYGYYLVILREFQALMETKIYLKTELFRTFLENKCKSVCLDWLKGWSPGTELLTRRTTCTVVARRS